MIYEGIFKTFKKNNNRVAIKPRESAHGTNDARPRAIVAAQDYLKIIGILMGKTVKKVYDKSMISPEKLAPLLPGDDLDMLKLF